MVAEISSDYDRDAIERCGLSEFEPARSLEELCLHVATKLVERYGWQLLLSDQLAQRIRDQLDSSGGTDIERCGMAAYCGALHMAASGKEGSPRQNVAYIELAKFLAGVMRWRFPSIPADQREDVLQSTIERVFHTFDRCREPTAFFTFATYHMLNVVRLLQRQERSAPDPFQRQVGEEIDEYEIEDTQQPAPDAQLLVAERIADVERFLLLFLKAHPLAAQQVEIQRLSLIEALDNHEIAQRLGISVGSVYTARSRFTSTVQREPQWRKLANDFGIIPDEA
jgi:RNA polymerase sigma factor (sigma-70 family)